MLNGASLSVDSTLMSRGLGRVQRRILEVLADQVNPDDPDKSWMSVHVLADRVVDEAIPEITRAHVESVRRAVIKLHDAGLVHTERRRLDVPNSLTGYAERWFLGARLVPPTTEIAQKWAAVEAAQDAKRQALLRMFRT